MIPRAAFLPDDLQQDAYVDSPQRITQLGFNISAPHMYAMCLEALDIKPGNIVLDIGELGNCWELLTHPKVRVQDT
jgi:protein-L-isoaspartate O-methyltransferase